MADLQMLQFSNPVPFTDGSRQTNPDPFVLRWCGSWYCYATDEDGVKVSRSDDLVHWTFLGYAIQEEGRKDFWAPSVLYLNGTFYMYYSNHAAAGDDAHEEHLRLAVSRTPEGPFVWKKTFFEEFSIDSHPFFWNRKLYLFYSVNNWIGTESPVAGTCILVDELLTPDTLAGDPHPVILPSLKQEIYAANRFGDGRDWYTIEGAATIVRDRYCWLLYSANAYLNEDYFVGATVADCKDDLMQMQWEKYPSAYRWQPLLKKNHVIEGTGHNTVTRAPNLMDDWIVYHARRLDEPRDMEREQREMYIDPLYFSGKSVLCPGPTGDAQPVPAMPQTRLPRKTVTEKQTLCPASAFYTAELWLSAARQHTGVRYAVRLWEQDAGSYLELHLRSGRRTLEVIRCRDGICSRLTSVRLPAAYDYTVPHLLRVERLFGAYHICLDEQQTLDFCDTFEACGEVTLVPYFSELTLHSFVLTQAAALCGTQLSYLGAFYSGAAGFAESDGLSIADAVLSPGFDDTCYTEEFQLEPCAEKNGIVFLRENQTLAALQDKSSACSVYHIVCGAQERFVLDGVPTPWQVIAAPDKRHSIKLCNMTIVSYRFTKN